MQFEVKKMNISKPFSISENCNEKIKNLLINTTLGTKGAQYKHLNTEEIIEDLDNPLFFYLERNDKVIGNITFCRREKNWYIRYFAFDTFFQSSSAKNRNKNSHLKNQIKTVFEQKDINFYAYIEPNNTRSKMMAETFGFEKISTLKTIIYSRLKPKLSKKLIEINDIKEIEKENNQFKTHLFYTSFNPKRVKFLALKNEKNEIIASARVQKANWEIKRLAGKFGALFVQMIPFIPLLNSFLKPKNHRFLVLDLIFAKNEVDLNELLESILAKENYKLIFCWIDEKDKLLNLENKINWGLFSKLIGNPKVDVVAKINTKQNINLNKPTFVCGIDLI
jgi:hypothetical protein